MISNRPADMPLDPGPADGATPTIESSPATAGASDEIRDPVGENLRLEEAETPEELVSIWESEGPAPSGGLANLVSCLVTGGLGLAGMALSWNLGLGSLVDPGPGFFPFAVALIAAVLSAAQIFLGRRGGDGEKFTSYSMAVVWGVVSLAIFVAVLPLIGFEIPALLLSFVWMKHLGGESWRSATIYSVLVVAAFYAIFVAALRTQIPHLF
ncbi:tripartite tricarboxylate transporter TctB family protein [Brevibacterium sanguinis]|uniref:Tripartite tricarboxylate transporter TctB family protein n=3 Tax=Brevibacteriaceae TaxID=85019 RepID=A0A366IKG7_9MICO|nr:tripartite tricarboxylate transporter TctB family protein [Brevibacterium sanguinis]RBP71248.1 tripartite tricarboxylate transporter TctB family protein [Brevibacterium celere]